VKATKATIPNPFKGMHDAPSGYSGVTWVTEGQYVLGTYMGYRSNVGPNMQRVYTLHVEEEDGESDVNVWGTTVIDSLMDASEFKGREGQKLGIQYLGSRKGKKGMNPTKLFRVAWSEPVIIKDTPPTSKQSRTERKRGKRQGK